MRLNLKGGAEFSKPVRVKLMNEYTVPFPLWVYDEHGEILLDERGIVPTQLADRLVAWAARFNEFYSYENGWPSLVMRDQHQAVGARLYEDLKAHFGGDVAVDFDYWETDVSESP